MVRLLGTGVAFVILAATAQAQPGINQPGLMLYEDSNFEDSTCPIQVGKNHPSLDKVKFGDQADSMRWHIPPGTCVILYESDNYKKPRFILFGRGEHRRLDNICFGDELDSLSWDNARILRDPAWAQVPRLGM